MDVVVKAFFGTQTFLSKVCVFLKCMVPIPSMGLVTGTFSYMDGWFLWDQCKWIYQLHGYYGTWKNNQGMYVRPWKEAEIAPNWKFHLPTIDFQALLLEGTQKTNDFHPQKSEVCLVFTLPETNS